MSLAKAGITFEPRNAVNCIDLAVKFVGQHLRHVLIAWCLVVIPTCVGIYSLSRWLSFGAWILPLVLLFATLPLEVLLMLYALPVAMGEAREGETYSSRMRRIGTRMFWKGLGQRIVTLLGTMFAVLPGVFAVLMYGFYVEQTWFSDTKSSDSQTNLTKLMREAPGELFGRLVWISAFCGLLTLSLFLLVDYTANMFDMPIFIGRIAESMPAYEHLNQFDFEAIFADIGYLLWYDPVVVTTMAAVMMFVFTIGRLAWFLCYVDMRVRRDLWNTELEFERLAARLRGAA